MTTKDIARALEFCETDDRCYEACPLYGSGSTCKGDVRMVAARRLREQDRKIKAQAAQIVLLKDALEREIKWPEVKDL